MRTCTFVTEENGHLQIKKKHKYYGQIQMGMGMLNLDLCYLFLYSSFNDSSLIIEVPYDHNFLINMLKTIKKKYFADMFHEICESKLIQ